MKNKKKLEIKVVDERVEYEITTDNFLVDITIMSCLVLDNIAKERKLDRKTVFDGFIENVKGYMERKGIK